jgi:DNA-binding response OmpR family regulator
MRILVVEDEIQIQNSIKLFFKANNFKIDTSRFFDEALSLALINDYDCIILDLMLPDGNGIDIIRELKSKNENVGIIVVSAKNALDDKINALSLGADDYLTKPFNLSELNARVFSIIRRRKFFGNNITNINEISIDHASKKVTIKNTELELTKTEYDLLLYLVVNKNKVITKHAIAENLIGEEAEYLQSYDFVYTHMKNLRKKMLDAGSNDHIKTMYSVGYKFEIE